MKTRTAKTIFGVWLLAAVAASAHAETYVARIHSVPNGYTSITVNGAGDNGLMAGSGVTDDGFEQALFMTLQGVKNLHPTGWDFSTVTDAWGSYRTGWGRAQAGVPHALFWVGGGTAADLHPGSPAVASWAYGGGAQVQVGATMNSSDITTACVWSRTASSNKALNSPGYHDTEARGTNGVVIVGKGEETISSEIHALMWRTSASAAENLSPAGFTNSAALGVDGNQQVGYVSGPGSNNARRAALWFGSAASFVNLHPSGFLESEINRVRNGLQVGSGIPATTPGRRQAIAWHGAAGTWINLHARIPHPFIFWSSVATDIDNQGNIVGYIENPSNNLRRPIIWLRQ